MLIASVNRDICIMGTSLELPRHPDEAASAVYDIEAKLCMYSSHSYSMTIQCSADPASSLGFFSKLSVNIEMKIQQIFPIFVMFCHSCKCILLIPLSFDENSLTSK